MNIGIIYLITNRINDKKYIGQTCQKLHIRWNQHIKNYKNSNCFLNNAIKKYGYTNFSVEILYKIENRNKYQLIAELNRLEKKYIKQYKTFVDWNCGGYNLTTGGKSKVCSKSTRQKIKSFLTGKPKSLKIRQKISKTLKGRKLSPVTILKMSKKFQITYDDNSIDTIIGLKQFCRKNSYDFRTLLRLKKNEISYYKDIIQVSRL